jgi:hypothetical protein
MATIVSSSKFRSRQGAMFDLADTGEQILIRRRHKTSYTLTPIDIAGEEDEENDDDFFTPEMLAEIDRRYEACMSGKAKLTMLTPELRKQLFGGYDV